MGESTEAKRVTATEVERERAAKAKREPAWQKGVDGIAKNGGRAAKNARNGEGGGLSEAELNEMGSRARRPEKPRAAINRVLSLCRR